MQDSSQLLLNNGSHNIKMIALDLDGTCLNSKGEISEYTRSVLERAAEKGVHIVVSTGRSYNSLPSSVKSVKCIKYAITSNGAHINLISSGEAIYDSFLDPGAVSEVIRLVKELNLGIEVFINGQAFIDEYTYSDIKENGSEFRNAEYVLWSRKPVRDIFSLLKDNENKIENVNILFNGVEHLEQHRARVEAIPSASITSSFINNLEVGGPNTSKKSALIELMGQLKLDASELMCCGDAPNDIQMIELAGIGVAMGNAWGGTAEHADYVTGTNDEDGVAHAIEKFVL